MPPKTTASTVGYRQESYLKFLVMLSKKNVFEVGFKNKKQKCSQAIFLNSDNSQPCSFQHSIVKLIIKLVDYGLTDGNKEVNKLSGAM